VTLSTSQVKISPIEFHFLVSKMVPLILSTLKTHYHCQNLYCSYISQHKSILGGLRAPSTIPSERKTPYLEATPLCGQKYDSTTSNQIIYLLRFVITVSHICYMTFFTNKKAGNLKDFPP